MSTTVCRVCLVSDLTMHSIKNKQLLEMYAKLAGAQLNTEPGMPHRVCCICYLQLRKCTAFFTKLRESEKILRSMVLNGIEISNSSVAALQPKSNLSVSMTWCTSFNDFLNDNHTDLSIKKETMENIDENDNEENQDLHKALNNLETIHPNSAVKVEQVDIKIEALEDKELEYENSLLEKDCLQQLIKEENKLNTIYIGWSCNICNKQFAKKSVLVTHIQTHRKFTCHICSRSYSKQYSLRQHMLMHTDQDQCTCKVCGKVNNCKSSLLIHMRVHTQEKPFSCDICGKAFSFKASLVPHLRYHEGLKQYSCSKCKKQFVEASTLRRHMVVHTKEKPFVCHQCQTAFTEAGSLRRHMSRHIKKSYYTCDFCGKTYSRMEHLKRHILTHSSQKPYSCDRCDKKYTEAGTLKRHKQAHHQS